MGFSRALFLFLGGENIVFNAVKEIWKDERGGITTIELIGYTLLIGGATAMVGYGISAALRGLAGKDVLIIKCADPAYSGDPRCSGL